MDPLSDVLTLLKPRRQGVGAVDFGGRWAISFSNHRGLHCYAVGRGECWVTIDGGQAPVHLVRDDCLLLASGRSFRIGGDSDIQPFASTEFKAFAKDGILRLNGGGACLLIGGHFLLEDPHERLLSAALPPLVVVRDRGQHEALSWALRGMWNELAEPQPGGQLVTEHLTQIMLIFALRLCLASEAEQMTGWLSALADPQIAAAMAAMHGSPERPWTLQALAGEAGMSRTVFSERFKALVGLAPMAYLTRWRLTKAASELRKGGTSIGRVALAVGYGSDTAFSTAFCRAFGVAPRDYARGNFERSHVSHS